jgi:hypothetical protein
MKTFTLTISTVAGNEIITSHNTMNEVEGAFARVAAAARCVWAEIKNNETGETTRYEY